MSYKTCVKRECKNTSIKTPEKIFVTVPKEITARRKWLKLAGRDPDSIADSTTIYLCENHFEMEKDIANYYQYKLGFNQRLILAKGTVPSKLEHERIRRLCNHDHNYFAYKKEHFEYEDNGTRYKVNYEGHQKTESGKKVRFSNKSVQTHETMARDVCLSPCKSSTTTSFSPFMVTACNLQPSSTGVTTSNKSTLFQVTEFDDVPSLEVRNIVLNVYRYFKKELELTERHSDLTCESSCLKNISQRTANATGVSEKTVCKILLIANEIENIAPCPSLFEENHKLHGDAEGNVLLMSKRNKALDDSDSKATVELSDPEKEETCSAFIKKEKDETSEDYIFDLMTIKEEVLQ